MSRSIVTRAFRLPSRRIAAQANPMFQSSRRTISQTLNSEVISDITAREKDLTGLDGPVKGGPTAQAQKHANQRVTGRAVSDITEGEKRVTGGDTPIPGGPAAMAQSIATPGSSQSQSNTTPTGRLDSTTISHITAAEKEITGSDEPAKGGPTAMAQKHANEPINSQNLHDITEGEKKITGGKRLRGGPTATAQSELGKSRNM